MKKLIFLTLAVLLVGCSMPTDGSEDIISVVPTTTSGGNEETPVITPENLGTDTLTTPETPEDTEEPETPTVVYLTTATNTSSVLLDKVTATALSNHRYVEIVDSSKYLKIRSALIHSAFEDTAAWVVWEGSKVTSSEEVQSVLYEHTNNGVLPSVPVIGQLKATADFETGFYILNNDAREVYKVERLEVQNITTHSVSGTIDTFTSFSASSNERFFTRF